MVPDTWKCSINVFLSPLQTLPFYNHQNISWSQFRESQWCDIDKTYWKWNLKGNLWISLLIQVPASLGLRYFRTWPSQALQYLGVKMLGFWSWIWGLCSWVLISLFVTWENRSIIQQIFIKLLMSSKHQTQGWVRKERLKGWTWGWVRCGRCHIGT